MQDLQKLQEARQRKLAKAKEKEERAKAKADRKHAQTVAAVHNLQKAKSILAENQHDREACDKCLSCAQLVLLLDDMGLHEEAHSRDGKRLLQAGLRALFWRNHVVPAAVAPVAPVAPEQEAVVPARNVPFRHVTLEQCSKQEHLVHGGHA